MRNLIAVLLLFISFNMHSQTIDGSQVKLGELDVDRIDGDVRARVLNWFGDSFKNTDDVIKSRTDSKIIGKYINTYMYGGAEASPWLHTVQVDIKEGEARIQVWIAGHAEEAQPTAANWFYNENAEVKDLYADMFDHFLTDGQALIAGFESYMHAGSKTVEE